MAHAHGPAAPASRRLRLLLAAVLVPTGAAVLLLVVLLHGGKQPRFPTGVGPQANLVNATVIARQPVACSATSEQPQTCITARVRLTSGPHKGGTADVQLIGTPGSPLPSSSRLVLSDDPTAGPADEYAFADVQRGRSLTVLFVVFAVAVVAVARWTGLRALLGLGASLAVLLGFMLPALLAGRPALAVSLVGSAAVLFVVLFLAHGVNVRTSIAVLGTMLSLLLCGGLAQLFVVGSALTGLGSDESDLLAATVTIDLRGLLLAGVVIGALGAIVDMTVTQASAVWQLHGADPTASMGALYRAAMEIGRDHVAAATTTLVLAYAGTALPLIVIYQLAHADAVSAITGETVGAEVVRTLVGSLGLVAAVPLTTALAALAVRAE